MLQVTFIYVLVQDGYIHVAFCQVNIPICQNIWPKIATNLMGTWGDRRLKVVRLICFLLVLCKSNEVPQENGKLGVAVETLFAEYCVPLAFAEIMERQLKIDHRNFQ